MKTVDFSTLQHKTLVWVDVAANQESVLLITSDGTQYKMFHDINCCEHVWLEDVCGDWQDLLCQELLVAEEVSFSDNDAPQEWKRDDESYTWTFYTLASIKGSLTLRWYGTSNGYYAEDVILVELPEKLTTHAVMALA